MKTVAIVLAAGTGSRLAPCTNVVSKPLVPVYNKPAVYYSVANLILAGIRDILIIAAPNNVHQYQELFGDGSQLGISISYEVQVEQIGIADAFIIGEKFIGDNNVALIFGDNIFSGKGFTRKLASSLNQPGATVFAQHVINPKEFGVVEFDKEMRAISLEEKPTQPKSNYAVVGVYFYDSRVVGIAKKLEPSDRGELEITDVNKAYLAMDELHVTILDSDTTFFDVGRARTLLAAALFVFEFEERTGELLGSPEAAAYLMGYITADELTVLAQSLIKAEYGETLMTLATVGW